MDIKEFGRRVRKARKARGLTQLGLAIALRPAGYSYGDGNVRKWESGKSWPEARALAWLAKELGVSADYLLVLTDDPEPSTPSAEVVAEGAAADALRAARP